MSMTRRTIFREQALQQYLRRRDKEVLPRVVSPPVFCFLWIIVILCLALLLLSWLIQVPVYVAGAGLIATGQSSGQAQAVLFVPVNQQQALHVGEVVQIQIGTSGPLLQRTISGIDATRLNPAQAIQRYHLTGAALLVIAQPSVAVFVALGSQVPAAVYAGSLVQAQIQVREQRMLSALPGIGSLIGG